MSDRCVSVLEELDYLKRHRPNVTVIKLGPDQGAALRAWEDANDDIGLHDWDEAWLLYKSVGPFIAAGIGYAFKGCRKGWSDIDLEVVMDVLGVDLL